jgi:isopenicillin N synthase-like dioxygenase
MAGSGDAAALPIIDIGPLAGGAAGAATAAVAGQIQVACRERGFFYVTGHGVPAGLLEELADASAEFFALPVADKMEIATAAICSRGRSPGCARWCWPIWTR